MVNYLIEYDEMNEKEYLTPLKNFVEKIVKEHGKEDYIISIYLTDDETIKEYNKTYRGKNKPTDVLSFCYEENEGFPFNEEKELGDIIISIDTMKKQAEEFKTTEEEEFARLVIHGVLHLLGFDHEISEEEEIKMFELQDRYLDDYLAKRSINAN